MDVGAGSGRDSAFIATLGHVVTAVEPSSKILSIAKIIHSDLDICWIRDSLPNLRKISPDNQYDLIVVSAVWMHVHPLDREKSFKKLMELLSENGTIYLTLRLGKPMPSRSIFKVSLEETQKLANKFGFHTKIISRNNDLLSRKGIKWAAVAISKEN